MIFSHTPETTIALRRMMAEQVEDSRDSKVLENYDMNDISIDSLQAYRQLLSVAKPQHPALELNNIEFLRSIGGWRKNRESGVGGLTLAGILMFGVWEAIRDAAPNYFVDYQERPEAKTERRWIDRICPDGTWSGNVFDFYRRTYRKLTADLKVPFELKDGIRQGETHVHTALREALVNTLVHADYSGRLSIMVVKRPDMFGFRNPGLMLIPLEQAIKGFDSDCRNRLMHQMFLMIGAGERSGSGIPKIYSGWQWANWRAPKLYEKADSEQTLLELSTASLIPDDIQSLLELMFGVKVKELNELEHMVVATAAIEGWVNHERACQLTSKHSRDVTLTLPKLVDKGFLVVSGEKRDKSYSLPGMEPPSPEDVFSNALTSSQNLTHSDEQRDEYGRFVSHLLDKAFVDNLNYLSLDFRLKLEKLALPSRENRRISTDVMEKLLFDLCSEQYMSVAVFEILLDRKAQSIRQNYLKSMVEKKIFKLAFPNKPNSPKQGYTVV